MLLRNIGTADIYTAEGKLYAGGYLEASTELTAKLLKMYPEKIENVSDIQKKVEKAKEELKTAEKAVEVKKGKK